MTLLLPQEQGASFHVLNGILKLFGKKVNSKL